MLRLWHNRIRIKRDSKHLSGVKNLRTDLFFSILILKTRVPLDNLIDCYVTLWPKPWRRLAPRRRPRLLSKQFKDTPSLWFTNQGMIYHWRILTWPIGKYQLRSVWPLCKHKVFSRLYSNNKLDIMTGQVFNQNTSFYVSNENILFFNF